MKDPVEDRSKSLEEAAGEDLYFVVKEVFISIKGRENWKQAVNARHKGYIGQFNRISRSSEKLNELKNTFFKNVYLQHVRTLEKLV